MDSNHHEVAPASPSSWCVYQFRHHRTKDYSIVSTATKKKYLFISDSLGCQQKKSISREAQGHAQAVPVLPEHPAGPELPELLEHSAVRVRQVQSSGPEQTLMT